MTVNLDRLSACFEGVIPSVVATTAADGTPNVSYLSHVVKVDGRRVALSNQFFAKTAANIRANRAASLLLVCPRSGDQYLLDLTWEGVADHGPVFDRIDRALKGAIAQTGMAGVMRLRAVDIFAVTAIHDVPGMVEGHPADQPPQPEVRDVLAMLGALAEQDSIEGVLETLIDSACRLTDSANALVFLHEPERATLTAMASRGYVESGVGAEVPVGDLLIGQAAATAPRSRSATSAGSSGSVAPRGRLKPTNARAISLPRLDGALSQIAVPLKVLGEVQGVLFVEAVRRLAFDETAAAGLEALARQAAASIQVATQPADDDAAPAVTGSAPPSIGRSIQIRIHHFDDSVFIDDQYAIKGVAGRLLAWLVGRATAEGRTTFSNREIRKDASLRLPEFKDNLETRLLLLSRRLDDRQFPIRLHRRDRGIMELELQGKPSLEYCE